MDFEDCCVCFGSDSLQLTCVTLSSFTLAINLIPKVRGVYGWHCHGRIIFHPNLCRQNSNPCVQGLAVELYFILRIHQKIQSSKHRHIFQHIFTVIKFCHQWCSTYNGCCSFIIVHWSLFIVSITSLSIGSCRCFFLAGYKYVYGPFFTNSLCMHIIGGTYSLHGYSNGTNGTMGQNLVGGFLQHELN